MIRVPGIAVSGLLLALVVPYDFALAADPIPPETRLVSAPGAASSNTSTFSIATSQDLVATLTDLRIPAALASANIVVTQAGSIVGSATLAPPATSATVPLTGAVGTYTLYVFGTPGATVSYGNFSVCVAPKASPTNCLQGASLAGNISAAAAASNPTLSTFSTNLSVTTPGNYTFTFTDLQFPVALAGAPSAVLTQGGLTFGPVPITTGTIINLPQGTYTLNVLAMADATAQAGLYGIYIVGAVSTSQLLNTAIPIGLVGAGAPFTSPTAQMLTLQVTDYGFPGPLASASALVTAGAAAVVMATSSGGAATGAAPQGSLELWSRASYGATAGTYGVDVAGATDLYTAAYGLGPAGSTYAYAFVTPPLAAGPYHATAADLKFPSPLGGLMFAVAQHGNLLQQPVAAGTVSFTAADGPAIILASAQTPAAGGNGLFDVNLQTNAAAAQSVFDKAQTVSGSATFFDTQTLNLGTAGSFDASVNDLKFPAQFSSLGLVISQGSQVLGSIFGGGTFHFPGAVGTYQLTFVATPAAQQQFGLYDVSVVFTPPQVTLTSTVAAATTGSLIELSWTTSNATSCAPKGGTWTGNISLGSGSQAVILDATTTYTLTCTGPGGSTAQSVTVTAKPPPSTGKSGGGTIDLGLLLLLGLGSAMRLLRQS